MNEQQQKRQMLENSTKLLSFIVSSSSLPIRTRTFINVIYVLGIAFMLVVFLVLLWVNLYSRHCWCWHDTHVINRFNRQWLIGRSMSKDQRQQRPPNDDELSV